MAATAVLIHGYHPYAEDAEIYVPGIKKLLNPALYPRNYEFFASHAGMTMFPNLIAGSVRLTHLSLEWMLLGWHFACILLLLAGCWKLGRICFASSRAAWGSAVLVASLLTIPVAGTALYIMDQYLNPRGFSTAAVPWIILAVIQKKYFRAVAWAVLTSLIHPLMVVFTLGFGILLIWRSRFGERSAMNLKPISASLFLPIIFLPPVTRAYQQALNGHSYFFLLRWQWYEWLGIFGPLAVLWWFRRIALRYRLEALEALSSAGIIFGVLCFVVALVITVPPHLTRLVEFQPMRGLLLIYVLLFVLGGGLLAERVVKAKLWRWLAVFVPICASMMYVQRQLFSSTQHVELPGGSPGNEWMQAFVWIRDNSPVDAYFALDPDHMRLPEEDQQGFRAVAERSMLADQVKDSGAVTMFPALAGSWLQQVTDEQGWKNFGRKDFEGLGKKYGVDWVVLQQPGAAGLECPYRNSRLMVCRISGEREKTDAQ